MIGRSALWLNSVVAEWELFLRRASHVLPGNLASVEQTDRSINLQPEY
jgi:hypothetical protein